MATPTWVTLANANQANQTSTGTTYAASSALTDVSPGGANLGIAYQTQADQLYPGQLWRFTATGLYSNTSNPTLTLGLYYNGTAGVALAVTAAITTPTNVTNQPWTLFATGRVLGVGASGSMTVLGYVQGIDANQTVVPMPAGNVQTTSGVAIDTTVAKLITVGAQWSANSASNQLTVMTWSVEYLTEP